MRWTPQLRAQAHQKVAKQDKAIMKDTLAELNPAAIQRQIQAHTTELLTLTTSKASARNKPPVQPVSTRASTDESTNRATRASNVRQRGPAVQRSGTELTLDPWTRSADDFELP